ncbi:MAG TPA: transketolase, partial [Bryobacteraceae bacterium]
MTSTDAPPEQAHIRRLANAIRMLSIDAVEKAKSGHPGLPMGMADAATVLFSRFLKFDPANPHWPDRDRFVLSAGHGSLLLYSLLYLTGYPEMTIDQLENFRQVGSRTAGHPEYGHAPGIETTTGPLGQGLANAVGMAIAEGHLSARFGKELIDHKTYVIASDGDLEEGISHEAISLAGHLKLGKLIVLWDHNNITIDGATSLSESTDMIERFKAAGWTTDSCNGHDAADVFRALSAAQTSDAPVMIACKTIIGFGMPTRQGTQKAHSDAPGAEEVAGARKELGWDYPPFVVPDDLMGQWRQIGANGKSTWEAWVKRKSAHAKAHEFDAAMADAIPAEIGAGLIALKQKISAEKPAAGTRKHSEKALEVINGALSITIGGSADLTPSNNTKTKNISEMKPGDLSGRYIHYGIREHGMAAAMNGMALHGGVIPYGGTFMVFSDYCRPSIRLAALMGVRTIFVMTHDSIGVGEDGPTHQPVEHLPALRAIPNLLVMRPADGVETAECWQLALEHTHRPSLLAFSRQDVPTVRTTHTAENLSAKGAYELMGDANAKITFLATGSEVGLAVAARETLAKDGIASRIVSMPCWALFE